MRPACWQAGSGILIRDRCTPVHGDFIFVFLYDATFGGLFILSFPLLVSPTEAPLLPYPCLYTSFFITNRQDKPLTQINKIQQILCIQIIIKFVNNIFVFTMLK
jgi:hypothetical protein